MLLEKKWSNYIQFGCSCTEILHLKLCKSSQKWLDFIKLRCKMLCNSLFYNLQNFIRLRQTNKWGLRQNIKQTLTKCFLEIFLKQEKCVFLRSEWHELIKKQADVRKRLFSSLNSLGQGWLLSNPHQVARLPTPASWLQSIIAHFKSNFNRFRLL